MNYFDVVIIGASASGLMCAIEAGKRGRQVMVLDHANKVAKKIRISGGGKCNFSNYYVDADKYLSANVHFCKSALSRYHYYDFLALMERYQIPWHEREHGQLFCDRNANDIVQMLLSECQKYQVVIQLNCHIQNILQQSDSLTTESGQDDSIDRKGEKARFSLQTSTGNYHTHSLVIATGGLSVSKMGASDFGLALARQFAISIIPTRPGLVPLIYSAKDSRNLKQLSGIALTAEVTYCGRTFRDNLLFTHKGLSGPVILQISSYWQAEEAILINLLPDLNLLQWLLEQQANQPGMLVKNILARKLSRRLVECFCQIHHFDKPINQYHQVMLEKIADVFENWQFWPEATEGYRVAEVTVGGIDTHELSSKTMEAKKIPSLYFIGEVVDVTGHLGGFNFQWAWASGFTAGQYV